MIQSQSNVIWHCGQVERKDRESLLGQKALTIWLTGLSAAGKSTLAFSLEKLLFSERRACFVLDGDNVRHGLNKNIGFTTDDRTENIRRIAEVARLMNDAGLIVIAEFISPFAIDREMARQIIGRDNFREVFVSTALKVCEYRDPKGLYGKARSGNIKEFTGVSSPYEAPDNPDLIIDTEHHTVKDAVLMLNKLIKLS
jgi:adenylyl-sulfate kinase